jgi:hypothetical protein
MVLDYKEQICSISEEVVSFSQLSTIFNSVTMALCTMLVQAIFLPLVFFQGTANVVTNITHDTVFYGQSPPVYPSRESQFFQPSNLC